MITPARVDVVAALIEDSAGRLLLSQRRTGRPMAGYWEFPGGKRNAREGRREALARELDEELGIRVIAAEPFMRLEHDYPHARVSLDVWSVSSYAGVPEAREGQQLKWIDVRELSQVEVLPADRPIVARVARPRSISSRQAGTRRRR